MLTVKERHQIERDSRAPYIYEALKREGLVDEATNTRNISLKEIYAYIKANDVKIGGKDCPIIFVSRADVEYTFKKFEIKGRKAGRKIKSVKADTNTDVDHNVTSTSDTTLVDTDNCTNLESDHSKKSVSTTPKIANQRIIRKVIHKEDKAKDISDTEKEEIKDTIHTYIEAPVFFTSSTKKRTIRRGEPIPEDCTKSYAERHGLVA
jgi:hypothetical protein